MTVWVRLLQFYIIRQISDMKIDHNNLDHIDDKLSYILDWMEEYFGCEFTGTSMYRPGDPGVHGHGRGWDIRWRDEETGHIMARKVNEKFQYDPARPGKQCCIYHDSGNGPHLHVQSHPSTKVR
jgi:hypothetical protein